MIASMRLQSALVFVKDLERMKQFYAGMLGVQPADHNAAWAAFDTGGARFALHAIPAEIAQHIQIASPPLPREQAPVKLIFEVPDVESARARLESLGAKTLRRPWQQPGEACDAVDPEGNVFQICSSATPPRPIP